MLVDGFGLTCATFVLTVFQSVEVTLVNYYGWQQRPDDLVRFNDLLEKMRKGIPEASIPPAAPEHVKRVEEELPCIRVRPEEVAATAMFDDLPVDFGQLAAGGVWLLNQVPPRDPT